MYSQNDLAVAYEMGVKEASKKGEKVIAGINKAFNQKHDNEITSRLSNIGILKDKIVSGASGLYNKYPKTVSGAGAAAALATGIGVGYLANTKNASFDESDLAVAYELGVKEASSGLSPKAINGILDMYTSQAASGAKMKGNVSKIKSIVGGVDLSPAQKLELLARNRREANVAAALKKKPAKNIKQILAQGDLAESQTMYNKAKSHAGMLGNTLADLPGTYPKTTAGIAAAVLGAGGAYAGSRLAKKEASYTEDELALAYEMGVKEASDHYEEDQVDESFFKAASLYETVYNDYRKQNLAAIASEWESMATQQ